MTPHTVRTAVVALIVLSALGSPAEAGDFKSQSLFGSNFFSSSPACRANDIPTFESLAPIPAIVDPFEQDLIPFFCQVQVQRNGKGVKKVKGTFESELVVRDNTTGDIESFPIGSGRFKTNSEGLDSFDFDLPSELFADGFESGDVSAWSYTRTDFTNKKKADNAALQCGTGASKSE